VASDLAQLPVKDGFRLRGESVSRIETFVDAAFTFAVTMMVISVGTLPQSVSELMLALRHVPTFIACFLILMLFWTTHNSWSRRYGLETTATTALSLGLVLIVLVWLYPLRVVMGNAFTSFTGGWVPSKLLGDSVADVEDCFLIYGIGFCALSLVLVQLYRIALASADELRLDAFERLETRRAIGALWILFGSAAVSVALTFPARSGEGWLPAAPGFVYMVIGPAMHFHHSRFHRLRKTLPPRAG
jgi:hypothetical protein